MTEEEEFFAWLDGELDGEGVARVEARVATDPELAEQARAHRALGARLRGAFDPVMAAPVPDRIAANPVDLGAVRERREARRSVSGLPQWAAMAATLVLGLGLGTLVNGGDGKQAPVAMDGGRMVAGSALGQVLDTQLAWVDQQGAATRIGVSFRDQRGALCRSFEGAVASGLACRDAGQWRIEGLYANGGRSAGDYRMAAGGDPRLAALIEATIVGEPLDAAAEQAARTKGWR